MNTAVARPPAVRPRAFTPFLAYVVLFHLAWAAWPFFGYPKLLALGERTLAYALANFTIRLLVWVVPVVLYLRWVDGVAPLEYLRLRHEVRRGIFAGLALTAVNLAGTMARFGLPHPTLQSVTWNSVLGTSFLVGFFEEIPYRGFMLRKFEERIGFWPSSVVTSLLFLEVHVPGWTALHMLTAGRMISVFVFGFVMAAVLRYARSLWAPIVAHSTNDFISFVLFHV